ncbi:MULTISPECIES: response regulator [unclassified Anabaena]|uniref:response regulator n=1 Tax=unclassified Anabaena TaxID=2619674 RepID=UPI0014460EB4|nr:MULTISPECIES: response regulator [unclassified Anabaena]MTJ10310.1 response regulator [Anabaena sp. UHCC 0204]MTJ54482.1 response regulator [Anabaena sp. UHCC 0253]
MKFNHLEKRKVVIADDDEDSRMLLAFLLEDEGWLVEQAKNGKEAIEKVVQEKPHLLILDNRMPELTGTQVYQQLQGQKIDLTTILVTAYGDIEELASSLGIVHFLRKPIDISELLLIIESASETRGDKQ